MAAAPKPELPTLRCADPEEWERWLEANHAVAPGVWLHFAKKGSVHQTLDYGQALEVALCFGG